MIDSQGNSFVLVENDTDVNEEKKSNTGFVFTHVAAGYNADTVRQITA